MMSDIASVSVMGSKPQKAGKHGHHWLQITMKLGTGLKEMNEKAEE